MRIAVLSDVHSNLEALDAVLERVRAEDAEETWVLGDIVGYGADPQAVVDRLREHGARLLAGNHDLAAVGRFDARWFNKVAAEAIRWTADVLDEEARALLETLQPREGSDGDPVLVHGSVVDPVTEYVTNERVAAASFEADGFGLCFFGHTHLPAVFARRGGGVVESASLEDGQRFTLDEGVRHMVNPGSVGQPRDGDPRASWLLYDGDARTVVVHRVEYAIEGAQAKIRDAGLPGVLADRLAVGR